MNEDDVIQEIIDAIIANNNNEITADVLRPVLILMVEQANAIVGKLANLNTANKSNTVAAINEVLSLAGNAGGITLYSGQANPNTTPPPNVEVGDFYSRINSQQSPYELYIYTGLEFFLLADSGGGAPALPNQITSSSGVFLVLSGNANVGVYTGSIASAQVILPQASASIWREITIVNQYAGVLQTNAEGYIDFGGNYSTQILNRASMTFKSDGVNWIRIK